LQLKETVDQSRDGATSFVLPSNACCFLWDHFCRYAESDLTPRSFWQ